MVHQPEQLLCVAVVSKGSVIDHQEWVWDTLIEAMEAAVCPECRHPTFEFGVTARCGSSPGLRGGIDRRGSTHAAVGGQAINSLTTRP